MSRRCWPGQLQLVKAVGIVDRIGLAAGLLRTGCGLGSHVHPSVVELGNAEPVRGRLSRVAPLHSRDARRCVWKHEPSVIEFDALGDVGGQAYGSYTTVISTLPTLRREV